MKKGAFILLLTIIASIPPLVLGFYTQLNPTLYNAMLLAGCGIEYFTLIPVYFVDVITNYLNKKEGLNEINSIR